MQRRTFKILFMFRRARINKNGLAPIIARITTEGFKSEVYIQCYANPERWNQAKERATGHDTLSCQVNAALDDFRARVMEIRTQLQEDGYEGNAIEIRERYLNPKSGAKMLLAEFEQYASLRQNEVGVKIDQLTANKYHRLLRYLREYIADKYDNFDISVASVNYAFLDGFYIFLQTAHRCKNNGAINVLRGFRSFMLYAVRNGWIEKSPFQYFKMRVDTNNIKTPLTKKELDTIIDKRMPNERLERVRDIFCFCAMTGLAFTDVDHLRQEHISCDESGQMWIHKPREKTAVMSRIPLLPYLLSVLQKYKDDDTVKTADKLLPIPSNQRMNSYLKEIADICNIPKNLTTHCARHTFASLAIEYGMPIDVIAKILGHTNVEMTRHYAKFSENLISSEMNKLGKVLNS